MSPRSAQRHHESKSIKTFFIYASIVVGVIVLSLVIKSYFLIKQSRFSKDNQFILSIEHKNRVEELALFNPSEDAVTLFRLQGTAVDASSLEKELGILPDAFINSSSELPLSDMRDTIRTTALQYHSLKTNMTIFDVIGLFFDLQKTAITNQKEQDLIVNSDIDKNDRMIKNFFTDEKIFSENVSIQIVNASGVPGVANRLERALANLGCNVVSISSSHTNEQSSSIQYFGSETYTLQKLQRILGFPIVKTEKRSIATIVITVGRDIKYSSNFQ